MISPSCYGILDYRQEEMLGKHMSDYYVTPDERLKVVQASLPVVAKLLGLRLG